MRVLLSLLPIALAILVPGSSAQRSTSCPCGWTNSGRIVGGSITKKNEFPWMAALFNSYTRVVDCGASIITPYHAISAAHCKSSLNHAEVLLVGAHDTRNFNEGIMVPIQDMITHPNYQRRVVNSDDIAVIVTRSAIPFSTIVGPACMPTGQINLEGRIVKAIGWGNEGYNRPASPILKGIDVTVIPHSTCSSHWPLTQPRSQFCTMDKNHGTCFGDSGGPWVWLDPETRRYTLVGATSYGSPSCDTPPPSVITDVGTYVSWIKQTIQATRPQNICTKV